ncbi:uncharacterized protein LOC127243043 [Andrographis paniculata]|uniref:uncharacterized protein LOC127243043 n=1 Tax=Andrographis paniculata TaxID=175694 RepID=UPI0021E7CF47|nr:uncharacterized protein LOC127243043 [Andrographis paniculata]
MPYAMKIQPIDFNHASELQPKSDAAAKPISKSRLKRLFERPFSNVLKSSSPEKQAGATEPINDCDKEGLEEFEPSSVCLAKMVQNFMEGGGNERQQRCGRKRCNCFNGNCSDSSDDERDSYKSSLSHACDVLKSLVPCLLVSERNLLADTAKIIDRNKIGARKDRFCRKIVADGLISLGYNASICKSKWEKSSSIPAGEYEYIDVIIEAERLIIDIDFRSEFEIARSTKAYKNSILQTLPHIFVGKSDRLDSIISIVSEATRLTLKKKGMPLPPWRKSDYVKSKWLSPSSRISSIENNLNSDKQAAAITNTSVKLISGEKFNKNNSSSSPKWTPPEIKPKNSPKGKIVTGLASVIDNKP